MSDTPVLDPRSKADILAEVRAHARSYTPEWNCDGSPEDPGSALAELFADMFYQTVDRMNSVMGKLHTEFLRLTGFEMPDPVPASGILQFTAHETVGEPVPVPAGTQVFAERGDDDIIYETERAIEATARAGQVPGADALAQLDRELAAARVVLQPLARPVEA